MDFLARFAGPLAWLVAGLLLLFGGLGGPAGPGGPGGNPFELGKSKARIIKDGDTKAGRDLFLSFLKGGRWVEALN